MNNLSENELNQIVTQTKKNSNLVINYYKRFLIKFPNGYINKQEFSEIISKLIIDDQNNLEESNEDKQLKIELCKQIFDLCDCDDNGKIDFKEYVIYFFTRSNGDSRQKLELIFDMFDTNRNNAIDFNELHTIIKLLLKLKRIDDTANDFNNFKKEIFLSQICINHKLPFSYHVTVYIMKKFDLNKNAKISNVFENIQ